MILPSSRPIRRATTPNYERALDLVRPGGLIAIYNVLWNGNVIDKNRTDAMTEAIRAINEKVRIDDCVRICMVPIGDGLTLAVKRPYRACRARYFMIVFPT